MEPLRVDFAVFGSTPLAYLVAGLLAGQHARSVCLLAEPSSAYRLPRGLDLSMAPITRPETWSLLQSTLPETVKLLGKAGAAGAMHRVDPVFIAETAMGASALSHIKQMATAFGRDAEPMRDDSFPPPGAALRFRNAYLLDRQGLEPKLAAWTSRCGVKLLSSRGASVTVTADTTRIVVGNDLVETSRPVLADDASILEHLPQGVREQILTAVPAASVLTEPAGKLLSPVVAVIDRDILFHQRPARSVLGLALGSTQEGLARIGSYLGGKDPVRRAGQSVFRSFRARDGAPVTGQAPETPFIVLADLGWTGAFLSTGIARWLCGQANEAEARYFSARSPQAGRGRPSVAEYLRSAEPASALDLVS